MNIINVDDSYVIRENLLSVLSDFCVDKYLYFCYNYYYILEKR